MDYPDDFIRICAVLRTIGIEISLRDAENIWKNHSDSYAASWLIFPSNDKELIEVLVEEEIQ